MRLQRIPGTHARARVIIAILACLDACAPSRVAVPRESAPGAASKLAPLSTHREQTVEQQATHVLSRLAFGARPGDIDKVRAMGVDAWITRQLEPERIADPGVDAVVARLAVSTETAKHLVDQYPPQDIWIRRLRTERSIPVAAQFLPTAEDSVAYKALTAQGSRYADQMMALRVARSQISERQLLEVMTDFWENHFSVFNGKMPTRFTMLEYDRDVIRPHALGHFRELLGAVAHSPAMLYYLDNYQSVADSTHLTVNEWKQAQRTKTRPEIRRRNGLNENYGRELLELHTLGVDGGYTQQDVIEVARALTGWTIQTPREGGAFLFRPEAHDAEAKTVLGHELPAGRGVEDGDAVLDIIARHPSTARYIARKLAMRLVSDTPSAQLIEHAARAFRDSDGDIRATLRVIIMSGEFFAHASYRAKVKSPFEYVVSLRRALDALPDTTPRSAQAMGRLGQPLWGKLTPNGWPETGDTWMNTGAILNRINFAVQVGSGRFPDTAVEMWPPWRSLAMATFDQQVDGVVDQLLAGDSSRETRAILVAGHNPLVPAGAATVAARPNLRDLVGLALGSPEFQRR